MLLGLGCKSPSQMITEKVLETASGGKAKVDLSGNTVKVETKEGTSEWGGTKLPDNWPSDAPVYPGASVQFSSSSNSKDGQPSAMVMFQTKEAGPNVYEFYKKELVAQGWTVEQDIQSGDGAMVTATKDTRALSVTVATGDGQTDITVVLASK